MKIVCIYASPPLPGRTSNPLASAIGADAAADLAAAMLADLYRESLGVADAAVQVWYPPDDDPAGFAGTLPDSADFRRQAGADLGERMCHTFRTLVAGGGHSVLLVRSDCVTFSADLFRIAFEVLEQISVIVQPAFGGDYVMVGQAAWCPEMFQRIPWGTGEAMAHTWDRLRRCGTRFCELPPTHRIGTADDLRRLRDVPAERHPRVAAWAARHPHFTADRPPR